jgi:hypothetical protein
MLLLESGTRIRNWDYGGCCNHTEYKGIIHASDVLSTNCWVISDIQMILQIHEQFLQLQAPGQELISLTILLLHQALA